MNTSARDPLVSVVIPAYNTAPLIRECLDSVLAQSFQDFEVIVVNDGSPDTELLEQNLEPYATRVRYLKQSNRGPSAARNLGIRESRGRYIAFLDSDDVWLPQHLAAQIAILQADPSLGLVYGDSLLKRDGSIFGRTFERESQIHTVNFETLLQERCTVTTSAAVASRQALMEAGLFDESMRRCEDFDLWLRMAFRGTRMANHREISMCHTVSGSGLSADDYQMTRARLQVLEKVRAQLPLSPHLRDIVEKRYKWTEARAHLQQLKENIKSGDYDKALESAQHAALILRSWKVRLSILFLKYSPSTLGFYYRVHEHLLDARNRTRAQRSARELESALPVSMKSQAR
ncbi:MAG TPA: glycosyltransferase family A protein [Candidatus Sulfotelmatobacter sp.]|nr:glycosyltransferase family A protein [Candidatus Sulfotelmatobacter sp.]